MADWIHSVFHFSGTSQSGVDITDDVISIPLFTDTGSGEVNEAQVVLNAIDGQYIQASINSKAKIEQFDRIKIHVDDGLVDQGTQQGVYDKFFFVMKKQPIKSKDSGIRLQLELLGTESFLQRVQYVKPHYFETPYEVFKSIGDQYNANRGTGTTVMPLLEKLDDPIYNKLPKIINTYDFGVNEDNCYDRMGEVIDSMGASLSAGGALDFYDLKFEYADNGLKLRPKVFSSGNPGTGSNIGGYPIVTIDNSTAVNVGETDGGIDAKTGTQVLAWGATESGSLPTNFSKFWARQQMWNLFFPEWDTNESYGEDSKVSYVVNDEMKNYIADADTNTSVAPPGSSGTEWILLTPKLYYGDVYQYSPWTSGKATSIWKNGAADPTHSMGLAPGSPSASIEKYYFWDHNLVASDGTFWRTNADIASRSDAIGNTYGTPNQQIPQEYLYDTTGNGTGDSFYRGFRVLCYGDPVANGVDGTGANLYFGYAASSASAAIDVNGKKIANSILQYDGTQWKVFARPYEDQFSSTSNPIGLQCTLMHEASTWRFNKTGSGVWNDITDDDIGNDSFHPIIYEDSEYKITNVPGVLANYADHKQNSSVAIKDVDDATGPYSGAPWSAAVTGNANSAVEVVYDWSPLVGLEDRLNGGQYGDRTEEDFYQTGAWISTRFPFPKTSYNVTDDVGDIFGGGTNTDNPKEPATLDTQNMHMTHDGKNGFNHSSSEDLGQINAISFNMKLHYQQKPPLGSLIDVVGEHAANFKMRCALWDTDDNCVIQDFTMFFNDFWQGVNLPISGFQIFKAREPRYDPAAAYWFFQPKGIDVQNIFIWRNIKAISIYTLDPYDEHGRYSPSSGRFCDAIGIESRRITLTLDALRFSKPLLASTGVETGDVIQPDFLEKPEISNYEQLKSDAEAEKQKHLHQRVEYDVTTTGRFDIGFGDYFNLTDDEIIPAFTNPSESAGQVKLVAKRIEYSISKPLNGKGGFLRRIRGVRRFV
jgi:hypothetical protein